MARGVNKVILIGNLGQDPETKYTQGGTAITTLSLATTSVRKDRDGNQQEKTEWHRVKAFGKQAEVIGEFFKKGRQIYIEGRLEYGSYEKDGIKHHTTDIVVDNFEFVGSDNDSNGSRSRGDSNRGADTRDQSRPPQHSRSPQGTSAGSRAPTSSGRGSLPDDGMGGGNNYGSSLPGDDIPFD